jgi:hypothetical protein
MSSIKRPYLRGKQTQILGGQQRGNGSAKMISMALQFIIINLKKISNQFHPTTTVQLIPYIYPAFVPFGRYFTSIPLYL